MKRGGLATAGILKAAIAAARGAADTLGDVGDEEAALVLDECSSRAQAILKSRVGPPPTEHEIMGSVLALEETAEILDGEGDGEAAALFAETAGRLAALLEARRMPPTQWGRRKARAGAIGEAVKPPENGEKQGDFEEFSDAMT